MKPFPLKMCGAGAGAKKSSRKLCESWGDCHRTAEDVRSLEFAPTPRELLQGEVWMMKSMPSS